MAQPTDRRDDRPTEAEWRVLRIVWERKECAAREVVDAARAETDWSPSTVKTLLRRLVEKGHLRAQRVGNSFLYRVERSPTHTLQAAADGLLENALDGTLGPLLAYMVDRSRLSEDELSDLRALLESKLSQSDQGEEDER